MVKFSMERVENIGRSYNRTLGARYFISEDKTILLQNYILFWLKEDARRQDVTTIDMSTITAPMLKEAGELLDRMNALKENPITIKLPPFKSGPNFRPYLTTLTIICQSKVGTYRISIAYLLLAANNPDMSLRETQEWVQVPLVETKFNVDK